MFNVDFQKEPYIYRMYAGETTQPKFFSAHGQILLYRADERDSLVKSHLPQLLNIQQNLSEQKMEGYLFFNPELSQSYLDTIIRSITNLFVEQWASSFSKPNCPKESYLVNINPYLDLKFHEDVMSTIRSGSSFQSDHPRQVHFAMDLLQNYGQNPLTFKKLIENYASISGYSSWQSDSGRDSFDD